MNKDKWVWMPHAGHLCVGHDCRFHLATWVGKYIVSTVGEYWPDRIVREIHAKIHDPKWFQENVHLKGDYFDSAYFNKFGWEEIGCGRKYETMVFKAKKSKEKCCQYVQVSGEDVDFDGYNCPKKAREGHLRLCKKWSKK
jgi:hypothetical protein